MFANPRAFSMTCAHLNCSLNNDHSSLVVRCASRITHCAKFEFGSPDGSHALSQRDSDILMCPSQLQVISKVRVTSQFLFFVSNYFIFWPTRRWIHNDTYPAEEHLTPNTVYTTQTAYVPFSMVCTRLKGSCVLFLRSLNILRAFWKPVELS